MAECPICGDRVARLRISAMRETERTLQRLEQIRRNLVIVANFISDTEDEGHVLPDWAKEARGMLTSDETKQFIADGERFVRGWHDFSHKRSQGPGLRETADWIQASTPILTWTEHLAGAVVVDRVTGPGRE